MADILPPFPWDSPPTSFEWTDWYTRLRKIVNDPQNPHNNLPGLQGGTSGEYYHLTQGQHTALIGGGNSTNHFHSSDRDRANHTGTQLASTISDFNTAVTTRINATSIDALSDVVVSSPTSGQVLKWNGTNWINDTDSTSGGAGGTNISILRAASSVDVQSDTGTDGTISAATTSLAGVMSSSDKTKLDGIATGATANQTDAYLLSRANHTGTQTASTISDFSTAADARISAAVGVSVQAYDGDLAAIAALAGTSGLARKTAANTWSLDTNTYLTSYTETDPTVPAAVKAITGTQISNWDTAFGWGNHASAGYATTSAVAAGYQPLDGDLTAIAALAGTSGLLRKTGTNTWSLDTTTYLTGNQTITLSGDATGSGATAITVTLANSGVVAGTYNNVATEVRPFTVDTKGRITSIGTAVTITPAWSSITGTPTTLSGYGITDAQPLDTELTAIAALTPTADNFIVGNGSTWIAETPAQARTSLALSSTDAVTFQRLTISGSSSTSNLVTISGTNTATSGTLWGTSSTNTVSPASNSTATSFGSYSLNTFAPGSSGVTMTAVEGIRAVGVFPRTNGDGTITTVTGGRFYGHVLDSSSPATTLATTVNGINVNGSTQFSGTSTLTATNVYAGRFNAAGANTTTTNAIGVLIDDSSASATVNTTLIGLDVAAQTRGATNNYGIRVAAPSGGSGNNAAIQLSGTSGSTATGILFGTDTNLYRSAANTLRTDDTMSANALTVSTTSQFFGAMGMNGANYGTSGQVLVSAGSAAPPAWTTPPWETAWTYDTVATTISTTSTTFATTTLSFTPPNNSTIIVEGMVMMRADGASSASLSEQPLLRLAWPTSGVTAGVALLEQHSSSVGGGIVIQDGDHTASVTLRSGAPVTNQATRLIPVRISATLTTSTVTGIVNILYASAGGLNVSVLAGSWLRYRTI